MNSDLTFITNEESRNLLERFKVLIKDTRFFDVLVGYFYTSGFYKLYQSLEQTEKIRILIGIGTNRDTLDQIHDAKPKTTNPLQMSHVQTKEQFAENIENEMVYSEDHSNIEEGVHKFREWIRNGKLQFRAYPLGKIHAKLYIMTFAEGDRDVGRVITGSSNFSQSGFIDNLEFNVELKNRADYEFALNKFNELWKRSVDVNDKYIETIQTRTWMNDNITPYELYLKFLYEYFRDKINVDMEDQELSYHPEKFLDLKYQKDAIQDAQSKLEQYNGVFISDVVGLGKTYISAMLARKLNGRILVIAPPALLDENNSGSWKNVFSDFRVPADYESIGKLEKLITRGVSKYDYVFIDEAHRFRTETNITYETLARICIEKKVVLVSATPMNNKPRDILAQIKLFQRSRNSTIPNVRDLENFFNSLEKKLKNLDRQKDYIEYIRIMRENAKEVREKVLKHIMVRRTRKEILDYFEDDLKSQNLKFPDVANPKPLYYQLNAIEDKVFNETIKLITTDFTYSRYKPLLYYQGKELTQPEQLSQMNLASFMRVLLIKRLESSFHAFRNTICRFIGSYENFIKEFERGYVYVSKKHTHLIFELLEKDDDESIQKLIDEEKAQRFEAKDFKKGFKEDLENDIRILKEISEFWKQVKRDPKILKFIDSFKTEKIFKKNKLIIFTESLETAEYIENKLKEAIKEDVICFSGKSSSDLRSKVIDNFDGNARNPKDDYRILVSTEVLSEGVNLHRSNVVINYDIPWNPTRMMQRVGRVNRVDSKFDKIYTFNFFPTEQSNDIIKLKEAAEAKIHAFITLLGADARHLTEDEVLESHELFKRLRSNKSITGEDEDEESELGYLKEIRDIRDKNHDLFDRIKRLPKKARTAKKVDNEANQLLTFFRKDKIQKFFISSEKPARELDFFTAAKMLKADKTIKRENIGKDYFDLLNKNKSEFENATTDELIEFTPKGGRDTATRLLKILKTNDVKFFKGYTENDEKYIQDVIRSIEDGILPKQTQKNLNKKISKIIGSDKFQLMLLGILKTNIDPAFLKETGFEKDTKASKPREVILSEYLIGNKDG